MAFPLDSDERPFMYVLKMDTCPACEQYMKHIHNDLIKELDNQVIVKVFNWKDIYDIQSAPPNLRRYLQNVPSILLVKKEELDGITELKAIKWNALAVEPDEFKDTQEFFTFLAKPFSVQSIAGFILDNLVNVRLL